MGKRCSTWWTKLWVTDLLSKEDRLENCFPLRHQPVHVVHLIRAQVGQRWPGAAIGKSYEIHHGFHADDLISAAACAQRVESDHVVGEPPLPVLPGKYIDRLAAAALAIVVVVE